MENSSNTTQSPNQKNISVLILLETGIFLILFIVLFAGLHFFNILQLDSSFPFLSFLPHLPRTSITKPNVPTGFVYETQGRNTQLQTYIRDMLQPAFVPAKNTKLDTIVPANSSHIIWRISAPEATVAAGLATEANSNTPSIASIVFEFAGIPPEGTVSASIIDPLLKKYFKTMPQTSNWNCSTLPNQVFFCETFGQRENYKEGFGGFLMKQGLPTRPGPVFVLYSCRIFPGNPKYATSTQCMTIPK